MIIKKNQFSALIFYVSYILILVADMFSQVRFLSPYLRYFGYLAILMLVIVFLIQSKNYTLKSFCLSGLLIFLGLMTCYYSKDQTILKLIILILTFKDMDFNKFIENDFYIKLILILLVIGFSILNLTNEQLVYRSSVLRNSFGFSHPNKLGAHFMMLCLDLYYINKNKRLILPIIFSTIVCLFLYFMVDSRTTLLVIISCSILIIINQTLNNKVINNKVSYFICRNIYWIVFILSFVLSFYYTSSQIPFFKLNTLLSNRLYLNHYFLLNYDIRLFGNLIETTRYLILDNSYINILLRYGVVFSVFIGIAFSKNVKIIYKNKDYVLIIIFVLLILYGFSESFLYKIYVNPFLLYFSKLYSKK